MTFEPAGAPFTRVFPQVFLKGPRRLPEIPKETPVASTPFYYLVSPLTAF